MLDRNQAMEVKSHDPNLLNTFRAALDGPWEESTHITVFAQWESGTVLTMRAKKDGDNRGFGKDEVHQGKSYSATKWKLPNSVITTIIIPSYIFKSSIEAIPTSLSVGIFF